MTHPPRKMIAWPVHIPDRTEALEELANIAFIRMDRESADVQRHLGGGFARHLRVQRGRANEP
jgi:hypothetical protein